MKKRILEIIYDRIKNDLDPISKGYDVESSKLACDAFDSLSFNEKKMVCEEIQKITPKAGTNSEHYDESAYVANLILFHCETWKQSLT